MTAVSQILNWISDSLLLPVIVLLLAALFVSLVSLGGFCATYFQLLRQGRRRNELLRRIREQGELPAGEPGDGIFARHLGELAALGWDELECEKKITEYLQQYERELDRARFMAKVGPMLGLMGTLIPMGPALADLASGDIGSMAYNIQIAFATTVVGCVVAGVELLIGSVRRHWCAEEISNLRYVLERQLRSQER